MQSYPCQLLHCSLWKSINNDKPSLKKKWIKKNKQALNSPWTLYLFLTSRIPWTFRAKFLKSIIYIQGHQFCDSYFHKLARTMIPSSSRWLKSFPTIISPARQASACESSCIRLSTTFVLPPFSNCLHHLFSFFCFPLVPLFIFSQSLTFFLPFLKINITQEYT